MATALPPRDVSAALAAERTHCLTNIREKPSGRFGPIGLAVRHGAEPAGVARKCTSKGRLPPRPAALFTDHHGPRALWNALDRWPGPTFRNRPVGQNLASHKNIFAITKARLGKPVPHEPLFRSAHCGINSRPTLPAHPCRRHRGTDVAESPKRSNRSRRRTHRARTARVRRASSAENPHRPYFSAGGSRYALRSDPARDGNSTTDDSTIRTPVPFQKRLALQNTATTGQPAASLNAPQLRIA